MSHADKMVTGAASLQRGLHVACPHLRADSANYVPMGFCGCSLAYLEGLPAAWVRNEARHTGLVHNAQSVQPVFAVEVMEPAGFKIVITRASYTMHGEPVQHEA